MMGLWYKLQKIMKSVDKQTDDDIAQFEKDTHDFRRCIYKFVVSEPPIPGMDVKLS